MHSKQNFLFRTSKLSKTQVGWSSRGHVTQQHSDAGGEALSEGTYLSQLGWYLWAWGVKLRAQEGAIERAPLRPPQHLDNRVRQKELRNTSPLPYSGRSRPVVGKRRSGPSRATRTYDDAEVESRVRRIRPGPTGLGLLNRGTRPPAVPPQCRSRPAVGGRRNEPTGPAHAA
jgi:hypothetical protein